MMMHNLPEEVRQVIGGMLESRDLYSCIRTCHSFYASFISYLWSELVVRNYNGSTVDAAHVRANAHLIECVSYSPTLTEEYYTIIYPRLRQLRMNSMYSSKLGPQYVRIEPHLKTQFARFHPNITQFFYDQPDTLPKEFWEVVETEWVNLELLDMHGIVEADAVDTFWRICSRVRYLHLINVHLPENRSILSTLSFPHLKRLNVAKHYWALHCSEGNSRHVWPLQLMEQVKASVGLKRLGWNVMDVSFPSQIVIGALEEGCWPELCEFDSSDSRFTDQDLSRILRILPSRRLIDFTRAGTTLGPLTYDCLREMYFGHLRDLRIGRGYGVSSRMAQEILTECIHLDRLDVPYIFVQDIATAPKPWGCLNIGSLTVFIAKQPGDNVEWEGQVFRQISKLRRLESLELQDSPCRFVEDDISPEELKTLDLRLPSSSSSAESSNIGTDSSGGDIRCWSSLVLMQEFTFETDHQSLGMEEALWMVDNWKDLWCICGKFTAIKEEDTGSLKRLFHDKDISHY